MNQIIVSQSNIYLAGLLFALIVIGLVTFILACAVYSDFKKNNRFEFDFDSIVTYAALFLGAAAFLSVGVWYLKQGTENLRFRSNIIQTTDYYTLKRDRALIVASKKDSSPDWLAEQVKVKIIDEDGSTYQVQFKDKFAEVDKKDVK